MAGMRKRSEGKAEEERSCTRAGLEGGKNSAEFLQPGKELENVATIILDFRFTYRICHG